MKFDDKKNIDKNKQDTDKIECALVKTSTESTDLLSPEILRTSNEDLHEDCSFECPGKEKSTTESEMCKSPDENFSDCFLRSPKSKRKLR
jgi:hypothetical protein